jgi:Spy/CpxP family protein refolding chaperone
MRALSAVLALVVTMWVCPTRPAAEEPKGGRKGVALVVMWVADLNLTDEQEAKIADIRKECHPKIVKARKERAALVKAEVTKIRAVLTAEQKEKLKTMKEVRRAYRRVSLAMRLARLRHLDLTDAEREKIRKVREEYRPKIAAALKGLEGTLTDEQRKARAEALKAGKRRREVWKALKLTDAQKEKLEAVGTKLRALVREEVEKIRDVLTEGQKEKLLELKAERRERVRDRLAHRIANFKALDLTDEQKAKIRAIRKEYRPKVQEAGNALRAAIRAELREILAVIKG